MSYGGEAGRYYNNRMIIDACRPYDRLDTFPGVARKTRAEADALRTQWPNLFTPDGKVRHGVERARRAGWGAPQPRNAPRRT